MLVLTRKLSERLYIGADICVTVVRVEGGQVRLGIDAPREVRVIRAELIPRLARNPEPAPLRHFSQRGLKVTPHQPPTRGQPGRHRPR